MKRFLITTALEETWRTDLTVVFLGEWCKLYSRKEKWQSLDSVVLPYHWDDRQKLFNDYFYLNDLYERLLKDLSVTLNEIHRVDHSIRYWRILLGPWLGYFIQIVFDRWCMVEKALQGTDDVSTIILTGNEADLVPNDMAQFSLFYVSDEWNQFIYSNILKRHQNVEIIEKHRSKGFNGSSEGIIPLKRTFRRKLLNVYYKFTKIVNRENSVFILGSLSLRDQIKLGLKFWHFPIFSNVEKPAKIAPDFDRRKWSLSNDHKSCFEDFVKSFIPLQIPVAYLEGYSLLLEKESGMNWPSNPRVIFTSNSNFSDDIFKVYAAKQTQRSIPLIIGQHGGHYGSGKWSFTEDHEIAISDCYFSWGWTEELQPKIKRIGQLIEKKPIGVRHGDQTGILLVTSVTARYSYFLLSAFVSSQWLSYFDDQCTFVNNLSAGIRDKLTVRLYRHDYGWDQLARWKNKFPHLKYDSGVVNINDHLRKCRISVTTYNATNYLESFTMDIPTIIYWNSNHWELRKSAIPFFEDLKRVGIFHETPESAAIYINGIWDDVPAWWNSVEVKGVVEAFKNQFSHLSDDLVNNIKTEMDNLIANKIISNGK